MSFGIWTPIAEKLPPYGQRVLITRVIGNREATRLVEEGWREKTDKLGEWWRMGTHSGLHDPSDPEGWRVVAWMPLPPPSDNQGMPF